MRPICPKCRQRLLYMYITDIPNYKEVITDNELRRYGAKRLICSKCRWYTANRFDAIMAIDANGIYVKEGDIVTVDVPVNKFRKDRMVSGMVSRDRILYIDDNEKLRYIKLTSYNILSESRLVKVSDRSSKLGAYGKYRDKIMRAMDKK